MADWSLLSNDLLELIVGRFKTTFHIVLFRSVCRSWRSVVPSPRNARCLGTQTYIPMFLNPYYRGKRRFGSDDTYCTLKKIPIYLVRFKTPFGYDYLLAEMCERKNGKPMFMWSPVACYTIRLGGNKMLMFNSLTSQIVPLGHYYQINLEEIVSLGMRMAPRGCGWSRFSKRVELIELDTEDCRDFTLLLADLQGDLMIFRSHDMSWAELPVSHIKCQDMVAFKGKFYVVDTSGWGHVFVIEPSLEVSEIPSVTRSTHKSFEEKLVKSGEELLLVQQFTPGESHEEYMYTWFRVFRLDEEGGRRKWVQVNDLNDRVIFLGSRTSLCCSVQMLPGAKENCIVFINDMIHDIETILVFNLRTKRTSNAFSECRGYMGALGANLESLMSCGVVTMPNPAESINDISSQSGLYLP